MDPEAHLLPFLAAGAAHCRVVAVEHGNLLVSLFLAGLVGSATHCIGMCGPFVLSQTVARLEAVPARAMSEFSRIAGAALVPYHLGRTTTYVALGAVAAALAGEVTDASGLTWLPAVLLTLAALFFLGYGLQRLGMAVPWLEGRGESGWGRTVGRIARPLFRRPLGWRGYGLGVALGFIPCGLLYGALSGAAASGDPLAGAFAMAAFALGTVPALLAVGAAGHVAGRQWRGAVRRVTPVLMLLNAAALSYLAWRVIA